MKEERYYRVYELTKKIERLQNQIEVLNQQLLEFATLGETLKEMGTDKKEVFVSIGPGIFANAELNEDKRVLVNVGADVLVKKSLEDSEKLISNQIEEIGAVVGNFELELERSSVELEKLKGNIGVEKE